LEERLVRVVNLARNLGIPLTDDAMTPIFFVKCGPLEKTVKLIHALRDRGYYVSPGMFPAVPRDKSGPRFTISLHNTLADVDAFMHTLAEEAHRQDTPFRSSVFPKVDELHDEAVNA